MQIPLHTSCQPIVGVAPSPAGDSGRRSTDTRSAGQQLASLSVEVSDERLVREDHAYYRSWSPNLDAYLDAAYQRLTARGVETATIRRVIGQIEPAARRAA